MGARVEHADGAVTVSAGDRIGGIDADLRDAGELTPVLAALACFADAPSRFRGVAHLRLHETDRLAALVRELTGLGGDVRETEDGLEVHPRPLHGGTFRTYDDHRIAMAAAVVGLAVDGVQVEDIGTTRKTVPDFAGSWQRMLAAP
jgi:3-phosphoshikimate 1-carboxyvinyltransferase